MKKLVAVMLTACLTFQTWMGAVVPVSGANISDEAATAEQYPGSEMNSGDEKAPAAENSAGVQEKKESPDRKNAPDGKEIFGDGLSSGEETSGESQEEDGTSEGQDVSPEAAPASEKDDTEPDENDVAVINETPVSTVSEQVSLENALEVKITSSYSFQSVLKAEVYLDGGSQPHTVTIDKGVKGSGSSKYVSFENLEAGEHTVSIKADRYKTYSQKVTVKENTISQIEVCTAQTMTGEGKPAPGWMCLGDVTGDGKIRLTSDVKPGEEKAKVSDEYCMLKAIRSAAKDSQSKDLTYDLNGDGRINIVDLQIMARGHDTRNNEKSAVSMMAIPSKSETMAGTTVQGGKKLEDLLKPEGTAVSLQPKDSEDISENNPVQFAFEIPATAEKMEGITIQAPYTKTDPATQERKTESDIRSGTVSVTYTESGEEKTEDFPIGDENPGVQETSANPIAEAISNLKNVFMAVVHAASAEPNDRVTVGADGSIVVNFGRQIAVKKVEIKITGTKKNQSLAEITKVEFVNDMESRIPAPELSIPEIIDVKPANEEFTLNWKKQENVTGYEIRVKGEVKDKGEQEQFFRVAAPPYSVTMINNGSLKNFVEYTYQIRSINGEWRSGWTAEATAVPQPTSRPEPVDNVKVTGEYCAIAVSWKDMKDSERYMVYYKKSSEPNTAYQPVVKGFTQANPTATPTMEPEPPADAIARTSYTIEELEIGESYDVYVVGWNALGWGERSIVQTATTVSDALPELPSYHLINKPQKNENGGNKVGVLTSRIKSAMRGSSGSMVGSKLDTAGNTAKGVVDNDYASYWTKHDWDDGVTYEGLNGKGLEITFEEPINTNYFTFANADLDANSSLLYYVRVWYSDDEGSGFGEGLTEVPATLIRKQDKADRTYYIARLSKTIENVKRIHFCVGRPGYASKVDMKIAEVHFHDNDTIQDRIWGLYADKNQGTLRNGSKEALQAEINKIRADLEATDEESGEKHPLYGELDLALRTAEKTLNGTLADPISVSSAISASRDPNYGFGGLNAWQPLGKVVRAGEKISVFVSHDTKQPGEATNLKVVYTQHHAESDRLSSGEQSLSVGENIIDVKALASSQEYEQGGQLYIIYDGSSDEDKYYVRIEGGQDIPVLKLFGTEDDAQRRAAIETYVKELEEYTKTLTAGHEEHKEKFAKTLAYDEKNCILNATDIMMPTMMYSVPATQVLAGIEQNAASGTDADKLNASLKAMEDAMTLFYQHKGLSSCSPDPEGKYGVTALPTRHLNIRYMRMFAGAFMYASGNHIGVEYNETKLASGASSMKSFGWGIGHEIGHDINQSSYAIAEVTNNYFAQLMTKDGNKNEGVRWGDDYKAVYEKVTSGTVGRSANVGTQLALYWQLHLAFDDCTNDQKTYDTVEDIFNNIFFARVDTYARNPSKAPLEPGNPSDKTYSQDNEPALTLTSDVDQNLMRLACAAAKANILSFFERWGMVPDSTTMAYAKKFGEPTEKALCYVNDEARNYRVEHKNNEETLKISSSTEVVDVSEGKSKVTAEEASNKVKLHIVPKDGGNYTDGLILGYEIIRGMYSDGELQEEVIGFQTANEDGTADYEDLIYSINNRVMYYKVKPVDQFLNYGAAQEIGSAKISTGGALEKYEWTVETKNLTSEEDTEITYTEDAPDNGAGNARNEKRKTLHTIDRIIDNGTAAAPDEGTIYHGRSSGSAEIVIDTGRKQEMTSLMYKGNALSNVTVEVSADRTSWTTVKSDVNISGASDTYQTIWFDSRDVEDRDKWIGTYDARYVKLTIPGAGDVTIEEIEVCGPSGDNLEFMTGDNSGIAYGILQSDYSYAEGDDHVIKEGSLVFTGTYKGNPAYNVVMLYDVIEGKQGDVVGSDGEKVNASQIILAEVPKNGNLGNTSDGTWIYWIEPGNVEEALKVIKGHGGEIRGELYRVDNAKDNSGARIVSDTKKMTIKCGETPKITLTDDSMQPEMGNP